MQHELKTDPEVFAAVLIGAKTHEIRKNDRNFAVGDELLLRETTHTGVEIAAGAPLAYTGRETVRTVSHVLTGYGLQDGWCILSLTATATATIQPVAAPERYEEILSLNWRLAAETRRNTDSALTTRIAELEASLAQVNARLGEAQAAQPVAAPDQVTTTVLIDANTAISLIEAGALRQYRHNDGSDGFVFGYDKAITDRVFASIAAPEPMMADGKTRLSDYLKNALSDGECSNEWTKGYEECKRRLFKVVGAQLRAAPAQVAPDEVLVQALQDIVNPIGAMKRDVPEGHVLNPHMVVQMADDPQWYKRRAQQALDALRTTGTIQPATPADSQKGEGE